MAKIILWPHSAGKAKYEIEGSLLDEGKSLPSLYAELQEAVQSKEEGIVVFTALNKWSNKKTRVTMLRQTLSQHYTIELELE